MAVPLMVLAVLSVAGGLIGLPHAIGGQLGGLPNAFETWLAPVFADVAPAGEAAHTVPPLEYGLMAASVAVALLGTLLAWWMYVRDTSVPATLAARLRGAYTLLRGKYFVDELYEVLVVRPFNALSKFAWRVVDDGLIDGFFVNGSGALVRLGSRVASGWETGYVQSYVLVFFGGVVLLLAYLVFGG
jgi:NADH-quinone oxidoreductase subunit L